VLLNDRRVLARTVAAATIPIISLPWGRDRHIMIDFFPTGGAPNVPSDMLLEIATPVCRDPAHVCFSFIYFFFSPCDVGRRPDAGRITLARLSAHAG